MPNTITRTELEDQLRVMKPGEKLRYHTGSLMRDRICGAELGKINNVAHAAFAACEAGIVDLGQTHIAESCSDYYVIKRRPPHKPIVWTGCYDPHRTSIKKVSPVPPAPGNRDAAVLGC